MCKVVSPLTLIIDEMFSSPPKHLSTSPPHMPALKSVQCDCKEPGALKTVAGGKRIAKQSPPTTLNAQKPKPHCREKHGNRAEHASVDGAVSWDAKLFSKKWDAANGCLQGADP